ncbi:MAG TPA: type II toxin-antitoxin system RelE/ParE family toxin [Planctomycetota bacterium]|nr:type II toxin-antitoxin system RelE/ParE family toxin [Planctomycetota bacterium]
MAWRVVYHPDVPKDLAAIPANVRGRIRRAIETRLMTRPEEYGERLRKDLAGAWKLRVGDYRIVFDLEPRNQVVTVLLVGHRQPVYGRVARRRAR